MRKILLCIFLLSAGLFAKNITIDQKNNKFSEAEIRVKVGDTITFTNSDPFSHNAYTDEENNEFDLGSQKPNETKIVHILGKGKFLVECVIHPDMALNVIVEE
ncbi:MAG: methylamine utilization protein [Campylobacteraceae bacterium]|nr:methylamine utilization protein [Campylobacteraceae bacterium]